MNNVNFGIFGVICFFILSLLLYSCIFTISSTEMGGKTRFGKVIVSEPLKEGLHFKWPWDSYDTLQVSQNTFKIDGMQVLTEDSQIVTIDIGFIYTIPEESVLKLLYNVGRSGNFDITGNVEALLADRARKIISTKNMINIPESREQITNEIKLSVVESLKEFYGFHIMDVQIANLMPSSTFLESVEKAVKAKTVATEEFNKILVEENKAKQITIQAQAIADARIIDSSSKAQSIELISKALSNNPLYLEYAKLDKWSGSVPNVVVTDSKSTPILNLK